jgi:hypothetical protein
LSPDASSGRSWAGFSQPEIIGFFGLTRTRPGLKNPQVYAPYKECVTSRKNIKKKLLCIWRAKEGNPFKFFVSEVGVVISTKHIF